MDEVKVWVLAGVISGLIIIGGLLIAIVKYLINIYIKKTEDSFTKISEKFDELINAIKEIGEINATHKTQIMELIEFKREFKNEVNERFKEHSSRINKINEKQLKCKHCNS